MTTTKNKIVRVPKHFHTVDKDGVSHPNIPKNVAFFYMKKICWRGFQNKSELHPFACVAFQRINKDQMKCSVYSHPNKAEGTFCNKFARMAAIGRLNNKYIIVSSHCDMHDIFRALGRHIGCWDADLTTINQTRFEGALNNLYPEKEKQPVKAVKATK